MRSSLPSGVESDWALAGWAFSPTAMYSFPSAPKWMAPPLWLPAELRAGRSKTSTSLPGTAVSPAAVNRLTWLWGEGEGSVQ